MGDAVIAQKRPLVQTVEAVIMTCPWHRRHPSNGPRPTSALVWYSSKLELHEPLIVDPDLPEAAPLKQGLLDIGGDAGCERLDIFSMVGQE